MRGAWQRTQRLGRFRPLRLRLHQLGQQASRCSGVAWRQRCRQTRIEPEVAQADFLIHPALGYWAGPRRSYFEASRTLGKAAARAALPALLQQLRERA